MQVSYDSDEFKHAAKKAGRGLNTFLGWCVKILGTILLIILTTGSIMGVLFAVYINQHLDVDFIENLGEFDLDESSFIYYTDPVTGEYKELETLHYEENRVWIEYEDIPQSMIDALIAIEDQRFWDHKGVDWKRTAAGFLGMFSSGNSGGGSTLTQQLIKNVTTEDEGTVQRKIQEILRALEFEKHYEKEEIIEWYLNVCYFGQGCNGIQTAAQTYFGRDPAELTVAEQACIIGITNAPTRYDPYLNPDKNKYRQELILEQMFKQGYLTEKEYEKEKAQKLVFFKNTVEYSNAPQSYFVDTVIRDVSTALSAATGLTYKAAQRRIYTGGMNIYTTINPEIQAIVDDVWGNEENWPVMTKRSEKPQSAMLLVDVTNGDILAMAGGRGEKEGAMTLNRATQSVRQPGSSMKPIAAYAPGFEMGVITPYTPIDDAPVRELGGRGWPRGSSYSGRMTALEAITRSINTCAVRVLDSVSPEAAFDFAANNLHISSLVPEGADNDVTQSLALGGLTKGASVRDMTAAYATFANRGLYNYARSYTHVTDNDGNIILNNTPANEVAMKEKTAYYMNVCLTNAVRAGTGSKARLENMPTAGKTGTTTADKDRWFCGYTPYYAAAVWFGFDQPKAISLEASTNPALHMWKLVMERVHENLEPKEFFTLEGLKTASYCMDSGFAPTDNCKMDPRGSRVASGTFAGEDVPRQPCNVHTIINVDSASGHLATPYCPEETRQRVALLNYGERPGIGIFGDNGYTARIWTEENANDPKDGELLYNAFCPLHRSAADVPVTPDPLNPEDPNNPVNPEDPYDPLNPGTEPPETAPPDDNTIPDWLTSIPPEVTPVITPPPIVP